MNNFLVLEKKCINIKHILDITEINKDEKIFFQIRYGNRSESGSGSRSRRRRTSVMYGHPQYGMHTYTTYNNNNNNNNNSEIFYLYVYENETVDYLRMISFIKRQFNKDI